MSCYIFSLIVSFLGFMLSFFVFNDTAFGVIFALIFFGFLLSCFKDEIKGLIFKKLGFI